MNLHGFVGNSASNKIDILGLEAKNPNRCCDAETIEKGEKELRERYAKMMNLMKEKGKKRFGWGKNSCKNRAADTLIMLAPIPKCWRCEEAAGKKSGFKYWGKDHVWVECKSLPNDKSKPKYIAFDSWSGYSDGVKPSEIYKEYPYPIEYNDKTDVFHNTCDQDTPYHFNDNYFD